MSKINNKSTITDLRNEMLDVFGALREGKIDGGTVKELTNASGKIMKSVEVQLKYLEMRKETPDIDFVK